MHPKGAFFTRGSGHNKFGGYTEIPDEYQEVMDRLPRKHKAAAKRVPAPDHPQRRPARTFGIITLGGCDPAVREAVELLAERGIVADYMRVRGFPFGDERRGVPRRARAHLRRRAEPRRAAAHAADRSRPACPRRSCARVLVYGGFPLSAPPRGRRRSRQLSWRELSACHPSPKPAVIHPSLSRNELGLTIRDYEGAMSTLCAGCGHDSVTAAIVRAFCELDTPPHMIAKLSGIGCSSKTPTYFVSGAHGFNSAHGRMPAIATGANAANRDLTYIGISGDGDSLSIGLGQLVPRHPPQRATCSTSSRTTASTA